MLKRQRILHTPDCFPSSVPLDMDSNLATSAAFTLSRCKVVPLRGGCQIPVYKERIRGSLQCRDFNNLITDRFDNSDPAQRTL